MSTTLRTACSDKAEGRKVARNLGKPKTLHVKWWSVTRSCMS